MAHVVNLNAHMSPVPWLGVFDRLRDAIANHRDYARIRGELNALTDAELADVGLSRLNVADVAREAVYGR